MFPIILDVSKQNLALIGNGRATLRRLESLDAAGAENVVVFANKVSDEIKKLAGDRLEERLPEEKDFEGITAIFVGDFTREETKEIVEKAEKAGVKLINSEDMTEFCNFHVPALVRRGDLLITSSTGGASPRLARRVRQELENIFKPEWKDITENIAKQRLTWKKQGADFNEIAKKTDDLIEENGWFEQFKN